MKRSRRTNRKATSQAGSSARVSAFTLVELLVALTIASVLTAIALPTLKDSMRQNSLSRSASIVKGAFINARGQAVRTGRPFGVVIERQRHEIGSGTADQLDFLIGNYATRLYYVQSPVEYRGDYQDAFAYPVFEDINTGSATDPIVPQFFIPQSSAGLLFAAAATGGGNSTAAKNLINIGTRFSVGNTDYVFEITGLRQLASLNASGTTSLGGSRSLYHPGVPNSAGTLVSFNVLEFSPRHAQLPGQYSGGGLPGSAAASTFPAGLQAFQPINFQFLSNPIKAPLAPVSLIGKTVIDLSISGTDGDPVAFNSQAIVDPVPTVDVPPLNADIALNDVIVMFAPDGSLDGVYYDERVTNAGGSATTGFRYRRVNPATLVSFNVGFIDGIVNHVDDMARFPQHVPNALYLDGNTGDAQISDPRDPSPLVVDKTPNFANTDCAWINIRPISGHISLETVASQPALNRLVNYYGYSTPVARNVVRDRLRQSRRLASAGTVQ